jgi:hypothetical protein
MADRDRLLLTRGLERSRASRDDVVCDGGQAACLPHREESTQEPERAAFAERLVEVPALR